ncbi:nitrite reductase (NADH) large subunit [Frankia sp. EI5c]|uniref:nitrite reductase large subunit NirB n=1 Tax=Frankia sp. EI5c TaxID=683316 RepID=UPI0007C2A317|nr:nitrite reductase large subunit NirB [Frankia sp. EI5c]OAA25828.1 nitrite reductase (NADH) large subunit [Frankia sp. EI5c]
MGTDAGRRLVVVGNGMVGQYFVEALRERDVDRHWRVTVFGEEPRRAYDRVALSSYFDGASAESLDLVAAGCYDGSDYRLHLDEAVVALDRAARTVTTGRGRTVGYDALVLATGSSPFVPPVPGAGLPGCFVYRTLDDLDAIRAAALRATARPGAGAGAGGGGGAAAPVGLVVGGGLLGLEAARALRLLGLAVHVVEMAPRLMPLQVDEGGGALLRRLVEELGVTVHLGTGTASVAAAAGTGGSATLLATLGDGTELPADLVVFAAGVRPRDQLARAAGLAVGDRGGVLVDAGCRTADPAIYAIGECACAAGRVYGLVAPGYAMGSVLADRLVGGQAEFTAADTATKLKLLGVDVASFGDALAATEGALEVTINDPVAGSYAKLVVSDDATTLLGGVLVGDASKYASLRPLVGRPLPGDPLAMLAPRGDGVLPGAGALPPDAMVCSCHAVTREAVDTAIAGSALTTVAEIKACTKAGTGCGSCVPMLSTLLTESGVTVGKALCEHFDQSRSELFEIVRGQRIRTFSELVGRHGRGRGCDVCRPVVASILASLGNGHILDGEQAALQDTNDAFLANIQRNGTYSVVPRIPGGEITPEKLIAIGAVARDFDLYTKITGGQRIDLLGARLEQLPAIWRRLVDAGFESGHAYGKALRTVKSCVGSTWCRYGVQDSAALAIELELRYRGIRSPHKIKAGVSGCARECAEARGKDIGVIATENGWNLYVGGNGGFRPRHADLLLTDVDTETLIRTIDRFIVFYVRTAERLQRTSSWVESLSTGPGGEQVDGLAYLRSVLVDDALGIAAELDAAIERHVGAYEDEWAAVLDDPVRLSRFVSFVNAPDTPDPSISFVTERGQPRPVLLEIPVATTGTRTPT